MNGTRLSIGGSFKNAGFRSLGSLAHNAFFSGTIEALLWPLSALGKSKSSSGMGMRLTSSPLGQQAGGEDCKILSFLSP